MNQDLVAVDSQVSLRWTHEEKVSELVGPRGKHIPRALHSHNISS